MSRRKLGSVQPDWLADRTYDPAGVGVDCPANPRHGQLHFPDQPNGGEDSEWFYYDAHKGKWLSQSTINHDSVFLAVVAPTMLWVDYLNASTVKYGAGIGYRAPYDLELCWMAVQCTAASTATFQLFVNNAAHAGSTLAVAAATGAQQDGYTSATIAKGSYLGVGCIAVTGATSGTFKMGFKRVMV